MKQQTLRRVVVTRPVERAEGLCALLQQAGYEPFRFPALALRACPADTAVTEIIGRLDTFDMAFFVSPSAVTFGLDLVRSQRVWPLSLSVGAVGAGTVRALNAQGFSHVVAPADGNDSEAVLALESFAEKAVKNRKIALFCATETRPLLTETLNQRGAQVVHVVCYQRCCPPLDPSELLACHASGQLAALTFASAETVRNFLRLVGEQGVGALRTLPVFVTHPKIAPAVREAGFTQIGIAENTGDSALLACLRRFFQGQG